MKKFTLGTNLKKKKFVGLEIELLGWLVLGIILNHVPTLTQNKWKEKQHRLIYIDKLLRKHS